MNYHHQLELLIDILKNQEDENYGTHDEYEQISSLISSLLQDPNVPHQIKSTIMGIEQYAYQHDKDGQRGNVSSSEIEQWVQQIQLSQVDDIN
ncbi:YtzH-like family protein [Evansella tamaricis]|uniref:YtzH-like family protein n=1 Tax=Evansella tamaricis TaxID=2069301 RepID=A0ABS6JLK9_9BACI|nr:YtzH-like family protein [Evansella tamaricis]MBU9713737.1 YtzH-like family protein [Evansella tamaricis]